MMMTMIQRITFPFVKLKFDRSLTDSVYMLPAKVKMAMHGILCGRLQLLPPCVMLFYPGPMSAYLNEAFVSLKDDLGIEVRSIADVKIDILWQHKDVNDLKQHSNEQLKQICKSYGCTFSNKKKDQLIETVKQWPIIDQSITEMEKFEIFLSTATLSRELLITQGGIIEQRRGSVSNKVDS